MLKLCLALILVGSFMIYYGDGNPPVGKTSLDSRCTLALDANDATHEVVRVRDSDWCALVERESRIVLHVEKTTHAALVFEKGFKFSETQLCVVNEERGQFWCPSGTSGDRIRVPGFFLVIFALSGLVELGTRPCRFV